MTETANGPSREAQHEVEVPAEEIEGLRKDLFPGPVEGVGASPDLEDRLISRVRASRPRGMAVGGAAVIGLIAVIATWMVGPPEGGVAAGLVGVVLGGVYYGALRVLGRGGEE